MKKIIAIFFLLLFITNANATCIVILKTRYAFYVAADSKRVVSILKEGKIVKIQQSINKIHKGKECYFAVAGHDDGALLKYATSSINNSPNPGIGADRFGKEMCIYYQKLMESEKINYYTDYVYYLNNSLAQVAVFGFKEGSPYIFEILFSMKETAGKTLVSYNFIPIDNPILVLGFSDHINNEAIKQISKTTDINHPELFAEGLVKLEMGYHKEHVGFPICLFKLTQTDEIWIRSNKDAVTY